MLYTEKELNKIYFNGQNMAIAENLESMLSFYKFNDKEIDDNIKNLRSLLSGYICKLRRENAKMGEDAKEIKGNK